MIDRDNVFRLIDACQPDMRTALVLTRFVGLQVHEIVSLRWDDIYAEDLLITIGRRSIPSCLTRSCRHTNNGRIVPLNWDAVETLNAEMERQLGEDGTPFVVSHRLRVAAFRCGLTDVAWDREVTNAARRVDMTLEGHPLTILRESLRSEWIQAFGEDVADVWLGTASRNHAHTDISCETLELATQLV